ncbi:patatin-like phospholipase family protein [Propylenella binzhouense]|uniref:Patatin-like phospholipase family protein n=1 Tax=Propylenella binzhouense TaxID=2555902 RepID=A0A964T8N8_9HYPH|nr:patatin-like phospholipase family protein [Propylenella binzhouense]MYZ49907.1 patatin-like phospholipase family protein [Propylenella binzhouense]
MASDRSVGLALGGGGARGIAHILVCEVLDELGVEPALVVGTSIGAIVGAGYSAGMSGRDMRERACEFFGRRREVLSRLWRARPIGFADMLRGRQLSPQFDPELILEMFVPGIECLPETFEDLRFPLRVVACDFYGWTESVTGSGPLRPAIAASIAIPAIFRPVFLGGRVQIDGGACNPLPFDLLDGVDLSIACDVAGGPSGDPERLPGVIETVVGAAQISMQSIIAEKLKSHQPDILVRPETNGVFVLDFLKSEAILAMNGAFKDDLKRRLGHALESPFAEAPLALAT